MSASSFALSDSSITSDRGSPGLDSSGSSGSSDSYLTCESQLDHGVLYPFSIDNMMFGCKFR